MLRRFRPPPRIPRQAPQRATDRDRPAPPPPDLRLAGLARRQHGAWNRQQATTAGFTRSMIEARLRSGSWVRLDRAVYSHIVSSPTWHRSVMAAVLAEPWAVASHRSAAVLHQLEGMRPGRPEVTVRPGANARGRLAIVHRGVDVRHTLVDGVPCCTLEQTFVDLSQVVGLSRLGTALAARADQDPRVLDAVRDRYASLAPRGGRDLRHLRHVLDRFGAAEQPTPSILERQLRRVLEAADLPPIDWEAPFPGRRAGTSRVDALIPQWSLIVEADGRAWHARVDDFERDRRRDADAAAAGFLTLRFTYFQLCHEPAGVVDVIRASGAHRAAA